MKPSFTLISLLCCFCTLGCSSDRLASWNDGASKQAIVDFVDRTTSTASPDFVPQPERIAVFDNDGTLWAEQPAYFQLLFAVDRVKALAPNHPEWNQREPFTSAIAGDLEGLAKSGHKGVGELLMVTHAGMSTDEFAQIARDWLRTAKHPTLNRPYTRCAYQPMLEVLEYLRSSGYKTFIVTGGGVEFVRVFAEEIYGIPPEQVVGSSIKTTFESANGRTFIKRLPEIDFIDDGPGKAIGINNRIGRRPVMAFGNSDGDLQMLQWTTAAQGPRLGVIVHHTDAKREWAYDRSSHIGKLDTALNDAPQQGWIVVDIARDWRTIYPK